MSGLNYSTCWGTLHIDGTSMLCPAWAVTDLRPLLLPPTVRGVDTLVPGAAGVFPNPRRATITKFSLPFVITGQAGPSGGPPEPCDESGFATTLESNIAYLRANVLDPTGVGDGTRTATFVPPSGAPRVASIHVEGLTLVGAGRWSLSTTLEFSSKYGAFA